MRRKLHLLILAILVMTMSLGMSLVVFAGLSVDPPTDIPDEYKNLSDSLFYVTSTTPYIYVRAKWGDTCC